MNKTDLLFPHKIQQIGWVIFAKEKDEDEFIEALRFKSLKTMLCVELAIMVLSGIMLGIPEVGINYSKKIYTAFSVINYFCCRIEFALPPTMCPKLAHSRRLPSPEVPQEWMTAHSELQELRSGEKDDKTAMSANTKKYDEAFCLRFKPVAHQLCYIRYLWHNWCTTRTNSLRVEQGSRC